MHTSGSSSSGIAWRLVARRRESMKPAAATAAPTITTAATIPPIRPPDAPPTDALLAGEQTVSDVAVQVVATPSGHATQAEHARSVVAVGDSVWYWPLAHCVTLAQTRCDVVVGATTWNVLPTAHCSRLTQMPSGAISGTPGVKNCNPCRHCDEHRRSLVGVGALISNLPSPPVQLATGTQMGGAAYVPVRHCACTCVYAGARARVCWVALEK